MKRLLLLLLSIGIGFLVWIISELVFPELFPASSLTRKVLSSLAVIILVTLVSESVQVLYRLENKVRAVSTSLSAVIETDLDEALRKIHQSYYLDFKKGEKRITAWVKKAITSLAEEMKSGYVSMSPKSARNEMAEMYNTADRWVIVTNVGSLDFFLRDDTTYQDLNLKTFKRGVPVIRFFLYGPAPRQQNINFNLSEFKQRAIKSMKKMNTVCGIFINAGDISTEIQELNGPQDFLLIDNSFVAHAEMDAATWEIQRIRATTREENIQLYRKYIDVLQSMRAKELIPLDEIEDFDKKSILANTMGERSGREIFKAIMAQVAKTE